MNLRTLCLTLLSGLLIVPTFSCSITATRPVQDMSFAVAALRAAKEVQADTLTPELYQSAREWYFKARQEYKLKNFEDARIFANRSRRYAEEAELKAQIGGGKRQGLSPETIPENIPEAQKEGATESEFAPPRPLYLEEAEAAAAAAEKESQPPASTTPPAAPASGTKY
jgi:hypothetical protein